MTHASEKKMTSSEKQLPSIGQLLSDSWQTFKKSWLHLFVFNLVAGVVLLLIIIVGIVVMLFSGAGAAFSAQSHNFAFSGGIVLFSFAVGVLFVLALIAWAYIVAAGDILIVSENGNISLDQTIKKSLPFALPLFGIGIIHGILIMGNMFLFIIPGIVFSLLFMFYVYEMVLSGKGGLESLRSSYAIVSQNFWGIFGRVLLLGVLGFVLIVGVSAISGILTLAVGKDSGLAVAITLLFFIIRIIVQVGFTYYSLAYNYLVYRQAKEASNGGEKSLLVPTIMAVLGFLLAMFIVASFGAAAVKAIRENMQNSSSKSTNYQYNYGSGSAGDGALIQQNVFDLVNTTRQKQGLPAIQEDSQLCAYAQRRLEQLTTYGKWDDAKGFYEDTVNPQIIQAYFPNFLNINEEGWDAVSSQTTPQEIVNVWASRKKGTGIVPNPEFVNGCIRGSGKFLVFIAATYK